LKTNGEIACTVDKAIAMPSFKKNLQVIVLKEKLQIL
jgi:hypothetical protein